MQKNNKGFTVLEMVVVLAIGATMAALAIGKISSSVPAQHLNGATLALRTELTNAKTQALKDGVQYQVSVGGNEYTFTKGDLSSGTDFTDTTLVSTTKPLPYSDITLTGGPIVFDPRGTVSNNPAITVTNDESDFRTISVTIAGRIRSS